MNLIYSEEQALKFYDTFFKDTDPFHVDFFCLAARKKYMSEEEKKSINLGDTCMMFKTILKEHDEKKFLSKIHQADACADYFTDRDGNYIPKHCIAYYMNINRTNVLSAIREFKHLLTDWDYDIGTMLNFNSDEKTRNIGKQLKTIQNNLLKSFQDPKNTEGDWLDIDCDVGTEHDFGKIKQKLVEFLNTDNVWVILTQGGCHVLVSKKSISEYNKALSVVTDRKNMRDKVMTINKIVGFLQGNFDEYKEIKLNQNGAIPLPGTYQNGFPVSLI